MFWKMRRTFYRNIFEHFKELFERISIVFCERSGDDFRN